MKSRRSRVVSEYGLCYKWNDTARDIPIAGIQSGLYKNPIYDLYPQMQRKRSAPNNCMAASMDRNAGPIVDQHDKEEYHSNRSKHSKSRTDSRSGSYLRRMNSDVYSEYRCSYTPPSSDYRQIRCAGLPSRSASCKTIMDRMSENSLPKKVNNRLMKSSYDYQGVADVPNVWSTEYKLAFVVPERCDMSPAGRKIPPAERTDTSNRMVSQNQLISPPMQDYKTTEQLTAPTAEICIALEQPKSDRSSNKRCPKQQRDLLQTSSVRKKIVEKNDSNDKENRRLRNDSNDKENRRFRNENEHRNSPRILKQNGSPNREKSMVMKDRVSPQPLQTNNQQIADMKDQRSLARQYQRRSWNTHLWWWVDGGGPVLREESVSGHTTPRPNQETFIEEKASSRKTYTKESDGISSENESDDSEESDTPRLLKVVSHSQTVATQFPMTVSPEYAAYDGENLKDYQFSTTKGKGKTSARSNQEASTQRTSSTRGTYRLPEKDDRFSTSKF